MELSIMERLVLLSVLPLEGNFVTLKVTRELQNELSFTEQEIAECNIRSEGDRAFWDKDVIKNIEFGHKAKDIVVNVLSKMNEDKQLRMEHMPLYEKFIGE